VTMSQQHSVPVTRSASQGVLRLMFGIFLAVIAIVLVVAPWPEPFAVVTVLATLLGAREWHRMVRSPAQREIADHNPIHVQTILTAFAIACAVVALSLRVVEAAFACLVVGAIASFIWARRRDDNPLWHAGAVFYLGVPALALVALREYPVQGIWYVLGLFLIVWSTDTGALVFGKLIGGAKLAPRLSPGKTWAGTIGGSITAATVFALYIALFGFDVFSAVVFALAFSVVAHGGDLLESVVKRRFGYKDSGSIIPGHGGVLDRVDSVFAASVVLAILVFCFGFNPMFGGQS
jgi:phosphatidate cytidylyltransferase